MITAGADIMSVYHAAETRRFYNEHVRPRHAPGAVLFDLDDTLFDHEQAARVALMRCARVAQRLHSDGRSRHSSRRTRGCSRSCTCRSWPASARVDDAREERFRRLFAASGARGDDERVRATAAAYREAYLAARRPVDGALAVLAALKPRVRIGIVSNNLLEEQQAKIRLCGFDPYVDALVVSEAVGVAKPDPAIFAHALEAARVRGARTR